MAAPMESERAISSPFAAFQFGFLHPTAKIRSAVRNVSFSESFSQNNDKFIAPVAENIITTADVVIKGLRDFYAEFHRQCYDPTYR